MSISVSARTEPKTATSLTRPEEILARLRSGDLELPAVPVVLLSLRSMLARTDIDISQVATKVEQDQRLAGDVVRLSNTPQYARGSRNASVREAITRLGLRRVHGLVETLFMKSAFEIPDGPAQRMLAEVWRHAVARGIAMRALADALKREAKVAGDTAYLVGLLSDVGASLLLWIEGGRKPAPGPEDEAALLANIRDHHVSLSGSILERWGFERDIVSFVRLHHAPSPPPSTGAMGRISALSSRLAGEMTGYDDPTAQTAPDPALADRCATALAIPAPTLERLSEAAKKEYASIVEMVGG